MKRSLTWMSIAALLLIGGTGWLLAHWKSTQRLGLPGVKVVNVAVLGETNQVVGTNSVALPVDLPGYQSEAWPIADVVLNWLPLDTTYGSRKYQTTNGFFALMNVVLMGRDRTSIHKPEYCLKGVGWEIDHKATGPTTIEIPGSPAYELPVMRMLVTGTFQQPGQERYTLRGIYVFWFVADGQLTPHHNQRMWWMARDLITRGLLQRWAYVSCFTVCRPGEEEEHYQHMVKLISAAVPHFQLTQGRPTQVAQAEGSGANPSGAVAAP